jgi:primosomal protein N' (replication factor Y)
MSVAHQYFVDVILPLPLERNFTYAITKAESEFIKPGFRVTVPFGKNKIYTSIALKLHGKAPIAYEVKSIHSILDNAPMVNAFQFKLWDWISKYYMCSLGEVMSAAIPSAFLLQSETLVALVPNANVNTIQLTDDQYLILEALEQASRLKIEDIQNILNKKNVFSVLTPLMEAKILTTSQSLKEKFKPKLERCVRISNSYSGNDALAKLEQELKSAKKLSAIVLGYFSLVSQKSQITVSDLKTQTNATASQIKTLIDKGVFEAYFIEVDRIKFENYKDQQDIALSPEQSIAFDAINHNLKEKSVCLFHGVTSSGKTEIYIKKIENILRQGKQALFLVPEIALTSQLVFRLKQFFGSQVVVYHSRFSPNERVEIWQKVLKNSEQARVVIGARSSLLLPFSNLGLIVVDEEHEPSYKQFDPSPRYHARDTSIVLANFFNAKTILGSATPSIESYYNATIHKKYGYVSLNKRYNNVILPGIELVDLKDKYKRKRMKGHFSDRLISEIQETLDSGYQVILFQNRRGYAPVVSCNSCGHVPQCSNCDVSLTFHQQSKQLRCHYCSYTIGVQPSCMLCGGLDINHKGFGTEQIQEEAQALFPSASIARMDFDTTRGKYSYDQIINRFERKDIDILVGTQMLTKGLDFRYVNLVGVLNADQLTNFPDFRSHERSFQLLQQVSGRAGRTNVRGKVLIQTYNTDHNILKHVSSNNYKKMFEEQTYQRRIYKYPPYCRLIKITLKHRDLNLINISSEWLKKSFFQVFGNNVLGPEFSVVPRIRNLYNKNIIIKIPHTNSLLETKKIISKIKKSFISTRSFRSVRFVINIDCY